MLICEVGKVRGSSITTLLYFILEKVSFSPNLEAVSLVVDKCKNTEEIKDFNQYIENQLEALLPLNSRLYISHERSHEKPGLQAVDMFCWGFSRQFTGDNSWYQIFRQWVEFETMYLP